MRLVLLMKSSVPTGPGSGLDQGGAPEWGDDPRGLLLLLSGFSVCQAQQPVVVAKSPERLAGFVAEAASVSRPRDLGSTSLAPRCTSEAVKVAVAVAVAPRGCFLVGFFPRSQPPELAVGTGFTHQVRRSAAQVSLGSQMRRETVIRLLWPLRSCAETAASLRAAATPARWRDVGRQLSRQNWRKSF